MRRLLRRLFNPLAAITARKAAKHDKEMEAVDTKLDEVQGRLMVMSDQLSVMRRRNEDE